MSFTTRIQKQDWANSRSKGPMYFIVISSLFVSLFTGCHSKKEKIHPAPVSVQTALVKGGSMAPALSGTHFRLVCDDCKFPFAVDSVEKPDSGHAVCPNCGFNGISYPEKEQVTSEEYPVQIGNEEIERWDLVAFQFEQAEKKGVKRIVGLPGETIRIADGDIWVNGKIPTRSRHHQLQMRMPHFDSRHIPQTSGVGTRWNVKDNPSWKFENGKFTWRNLSSSTPVRDSEPDTVPREQAWLIYQPAYCFASHKNRQTSDVVFDNYGFNQAIRRTELNPVDQIMVEFPIESASDCRLEISTVCNGSQVVFEIDTVNNQASVRTASRTVTSALPDTVRSREIFQVEICTFDRRPTLRLNDQVVCRIDLSQDKQHQTAPDAESLFKLRIDSPSPKPADHTGSAVVGPIQIFRDLYYFSAGASEFKTGEDEFILLGDNVPISKDSRKWSKPAVKRDQIIGTLRLDLPDTE